VPLADAVVPQHRADDRNAGGLRDVVGVLDAPVETDSRHSRGRGNQDSEKETHRCVAQDLRRAGRVRGDRPLRDGHFHGRSATAVRGFQVGDEQRELVAHRIRDALRLGRGVTDDGDIDEDRIAQDVRGDPATEPLRRYVQVQAIDDSAGQRLPCYQLGV
jgi:hypothetical protein